MLVDEEDAVDEEPPWSPVAKPSRSCSVASGVRGGEHELRRRGDRGVAAEPDERGGTAVLGEEFRTVGVEEGGDETGVTRARVGEALERQFCDALLHDRADGVVDRRLGSASRSPSSG
ncbi:hypothetical protein [Plantibacter flavus]|uniref:hypothetical protein n=1 Tax=Plantibacter flavus TaxID=150123 RepID=UPI001F0ABAA7|nr:hypothetical protein [Plantibacter flavus]